MAAMGCSVEGCDRKHKGNGYCYAHNLRYKAHGDPMADKPLREHHTGCKVTGCDRAHKAKGYCEPHYRRVKEFGSPNAGAPIRGDDDARFNSHVEMIPETSCHWWTGVVNHNGYGRVKVKRKQMQAHRYAYERAIGPIPPGMFVCHSCDNPSCVNPEHLFLGTPGDNMRDKVQKGRQSRGEGFGMSKLTESDVIKIRRGNDSAASIAAALNVHPSTVNYVRNGKTWKHVS